MVTVVNAAYGHQGGSVIFQSKVLEKNIQDVTGHRSVKAQRKELAIQQQQAASNLLTGNL